MIRYSVAIVTKVMDDAGDPVTPPVQCTTNFRAYFADSTDSADVLRKHDEVVEGAQKTCGWPLDDVFPNPRREQD